MTEDLTTDKGTLKVRKTSPLVRFALKNGGASPARQRHFFADGSWAVRGLRSSWTWDIIAPHGVGFIAEGVDTQVVTAHALNVGYADRFTMPSTTDD